MPLILEKGSCCEFCWDIFNGTLCEKSGNKSSPNMCTSVWWYYSATGRDPIFGTTIVSYVTFAIRWFMNHIHWMIFIPERHDAMNHFKRNLILFHNVPIIPNKSMPLPHHFNIIPILNYQTTQPLMFHSVIQKKNTTMSL